MQKGSSTSLNTASSDALQQPAEGIWSGLEWSRRVVVTMLDFLVAVALSFLVTWVVVPLLHVASSDPNRRALQTQWCLHRVTSFFLLLLRFTGLFRFELHGTERLREPGILVVANHPTFIDALILIAQMPQAYCVVKKDFHRNLFFGPTARAAGYVPSEDGLELVNTCARHLSEGRSAIIFPEGTRSPADDLGPFQRGVAHIALRTGCRPIPVTIRAHPATLYRDRPWWDVPSRRPTLSIRVGEPFECELGNDANLSRPRAARAYTASLRAYFQRDLDVG